MRAYSPGGALNALATALRSKTPTPSAHRLQRGLPGYLILFAPHAFVSQRQYMARSSPSPLMFFQISKISPLHLEFQLPFLYSSHAVSSAAPQLSCGITHQTYLAACIPFTPNNSEQRSPHTCYRGCWHVISRGLFMDYRHHSGIPSKAYSSSIKGLYNVSAFITHATSLRQTFVHCGRFLAAASRRSLGRISVPVWPSTLSGRLLIVALVSHYLTN